MAIWPNFRFRSITHRLIFSCIIAASVIYSVSYWHIRQAMQQGVTSWMTQVAQSHVDALAAEITGILRSVEQNAHIVVRADSTVPLIQTLMAQQSVVRAVLVARIPTALGPIESFGLRKSRSGVYEAMGDREKTSLLTHCQSNSSAIEPHWTQPYQRNPSSKSLGMIYCEPLHQTLGQEQVNPGWLAIEISLDWLPPLVTSKLPVVDKFNYIELRQVFVIALPTRQWLVSPPESTKTLSWFSQKNTTSNDSGSQILVDSQGILVFTTLPSTSWRLGIALPDSDFWRFQDKYFWLVIASMAKDMVLMCVAIALVSRQTTRSLRALITSTEDIARGNIDTVLPVIPYRDEVGRLAQAFRHMRNALKIHIQDLQETTAAKQKMESELSIAAQIQRSMVPQIEVANGSNQYYELSALFQPARIVGGDLYDFFPLQDDRLCILIGDVADKGVPAALLMARTVTLIRMLAKQTSTPIEILSAVNRELCTNNPECLFVTLFCGVLNLHTGILHYASGGHDPPILVRDRSVRFLDLETGPPMGLDEEAIFPQCEYFLERNDLILLYTDGITEGMNPQEEPFSDVRLIDILRCYPPSNPVRAIRTIQHFHRQFVADAPQSDDMTLLVLQYQPSDLALHESKIVERKITINSQLTELEKVKESLGKILEGEWLAVESIEDAQLIVEEVVVNIIQYGYANQCQNCIDLQIKIGADTLTMTFEDRGTPFNPLTNIDNPDLSMDDEQRSSGGLGFYLVRELAERIDYIHRDGKNILTIFQTITKKT